MAHALFDKKFGSDLLLSVPLGPGVYLFKNESGEVIYVGKAKSLRRRLQGYRNAGRKKVHRKMVRIVKAAFSLDYQEVETEEKALLRENELILELKPALNVDGAFSFLYPALGVTTTERHTLICLTTAPEEYRQLELHWFGTFRSRPRAKLAFESLVELLSLIGHREKKTALPSHPNLRGSRLVGFRQVPVDLTETLPWFLAGEDEAFIGMLARHLLQKPRARREAAVVEEHLKTVRAFFQQDAARLHAALRKLGRPGSFIPARERDSLFIRSRFGEES